MHQKFLPWKRRVRCATTDGGLNYIYDATVVIQPVGDDDGNVTGRSASGASVTLYADEVMVRIERDTADHSGGMQEVELERTRKLKQSANFKAKLYKSAANLFNRLANTGGTVVSFTITGTGGTCSGVGICKHNQADYGAPSTHEFNLGSYGTKWIVSG